MNPSDWNFTLTTSDLADLSESEFEALWAMLAKVVRNRLVRSPLKSILDGEET